MLQEVDEAEQYIFHLYATETIFYHNTDAKMVYSLPNAENANIFYTHIFNCCSSKQLHDIIKQRTLKSDVIIEL